MGLEKYTKKQKVIPVGDSNDADIAAKLLL